MGSREEKIAGAIMEIAENVESYEELSDVARLVLSEFKKRNLPRPEGGKTDG